MSRVMSTVVCWMVVGIHVETSVLNWITPLNLRIVMRQACITVFGEERCDCAGESSIPWPRTNIDQEGQNRIASRQ